MKYFFVIIFISSLSLHAFSQHQCATELMHEQKQQTQPSQYWKEKNYEEFLNAITQTKKNLKPSAVPEETYIIPVVVHVIHNTASGTKGGPGNTNISDQQIYSQITVLNEDFRKLPGTNGFNTDPVGADVNIEFCLASRAPDGSYTSGITRRYFNKSQWALNSSDDNLLKSLSYWPSDQYLNIWVCNLEDPFLGYAQLPSGSSLPDIVGDPGATTDGVVLDYKSFGKGGAVSGYYTLGRTCTHEVGHWLGLLHTWGDSFCGTDHVADTPTDQNPNNDLDCKDSSDCDGNDIYVQDMTNNYMDYSRDICMNIFTEGQKLRMRTVMETAPRRMSLLTSLGCCIRPLTNLPLYEDFEGIISSNNIAIENPNSNITWSTTSPGGFSHSSTSILLKNDSAVINEKDYLVTPFLNFANERPVLEFEYAYAQDPTLETDTLVVSYSTDCVIFTPLTTLYESNLLTTTTVTDNFVPASNEWKKVKMNLTSLYGRPAVKFRFENRSNKKDNLYVDNINIYKTSEELLVKPYPNPAEDFINIEVIFEEEQDITYQLFDMLGQQIFETTDYQKTSYTKSINVDKISTGMYLLKVSTANQTKTVKVLLNF